MDIVVDTSVIIAVIADEPERESLVKVTKGADLLAPLSVHWELGNAFSAMFRRQRIDLASALKAVDIYRRIPIRFVEVELKASLEIAAELGIYAYDAYLIRCALKYRAPLLSLDDALIDSAQRLGATVVEVTG